MLYQHISRSQRKEIVKNTANYKNRKENIKKEIYFCSLFNFCYNIFNYSHKLLSICYK